jgi:hypothetical protein
MTASQVGLGNHWKARMPYDRQLSAGSWLLIRDHERGRATLVTPFEPPRKRGIEPTVREAIADMVERIVDCVDLLVATASWISAAGVITVCDVHDVTWFARYRHAHLSVSIELPESSPTRRRAAR